jgi:hypothetical protein
MDFLLRSCARLDECGLALAAGGGNLAGDPAYAPVKAELMRWLPKVNAPDAPRINRPGNN